MKKMKMVAIFLSIFTFFLSSGAYCQDHAGRIVKVFGEAKLINIDGQEKSLHIGDYVHEGEQIETSKSSMVKLLMNDDTLFHVGPNSHFVLEKFQLITKSDRQAVYHLLKGKMRSLFTIKAEKDQLKIKTPNAAMGVRGTEIVSDVYMKDEKLQTDIALVSGKLEIEGIDDKGQGSVYELNAGELFSARVSEGKSNAIKNAIKLDEKVLQQLRGGEKSGKLFLHDAMKAAGQDITARFDFSSQRPRFRRKSEDRAPASVNEKSLEEDKHINLREVSQSVKGIHENIADSIRAAVEKVVESESDAKADVETEMKALSIARKKIKEVRDDIVRETADEATSKATDIILNKGDKHFSSTSTGTGISEIAREARETGSTFAKKLAIEKLEDRAVSKVQGQVESEIYNKTMETVETKTMAKALSAALDAAKKSSMESGIEMNSDIEKLARSLAEAATQKASGIAADKAVREASQKAMAQAVKEASQEIAERAARIAGDRAANESVRKTQMEIRNRLMKGNIMEKSMRLPASVQMDQQRRIDREIQNTTILNKETEQIRLQQEEYKLLPPPDTTLKCGSTLGC